MGHQTMTFAAEPGKETPLGIAKSHQLLFVLLAALLCAGPFIAYPLLVIKVLCFGLFAMSLNLMLGNLGLLSFGHAAYFGISSYAAAHAAKVWGLTPELALLFAVAVSLLLGAIFGALSVRRSGIYFAMVTLAFAQMIYFFSLQAPFTGGEDGIQNVPRGALFGVISLQNDLNLYAMVAILFLLAVLAIWRITYSPLGQILRAIRDNEPRTISLGYRVERYKWLTFVLAAGFAGLAGGLKAISFQLASLTDVYWGMSGEVVLMVMIGGMASFFGPLIGALLVIWMQNELAAFGAWVTIMQGVVFMLCVLLFRQGLLGTIAEKLRLRL
ncbi:branched-chain amino acid ABC transporter permease [Pseudogemmobacter faecipullorum]|uniref:Branched-chain amino acid ABC transporter permease n=1 Tax=Pseudogemmobacter faecipullorum TaxID=2755041 RepID=A0ABS8CN02_9RHOB|nr:branched-chain amino acid ABC transporter permease [Pseudogemmobacter faecipullorum]MCB5410770.1 branched-chain amino acid ABC transporter permease [Pseudogemmobacter faecipullorum]